ncbi:unnamed protein product, partial [Sphagnum compactum]
SEMFNCHYNQNKGYVVFSAMGSFFIPMTVMLYVYSKIFYVLMSRQHRMTKTELSINESCLSTSKFKIHSHGNRMPIRISSLRRETKTAQTLSMVVGGFVVC